MAIDRKGIRNMHHFKRNAQGFTLLELIVVIAIIGFLTAMVVPRLAGVFDDAGEAISDQNQSRLRQYINLKLSDDGDYPTKLISIVGWNGSEFYKPTVQGIDTGPGPWTLSDDIEEHHNLHLHILNAVEARELRRLGVDRVMILEYMDGDVQRAFHEVPVEAGLGVLMAGAGNTGSWTHVIDDPEKEWEMPQHIYSMVFGIGPDSELVEGGYIESAPRCPDALRNKDATYNWYSIVMPRLRSTTDRLQGSGLPRVVRFENDDTRQLRVFNIGDTHEKWRFATICPEGHTYPEYEGFGEWELDYRDADDTGIISIFE